MVSGLRLAWRRWQLRIRGSLGVKLLLILTGVGLAGSAALAVLLASVIMPGFNQLEDTAVTGQVERTRVALREFASKVQTGVHDYGDWNAGYDYMAHPTRAFEEENLSPLAMANLGVDGIAYAGRDGKVVMARWIDLSNQADIPALRTGFANAVQKIDLDNALLGGSAGSFYLRLGDRLAAVGIAQVRRGDGSGLPRGYVLMARALNPAQLSSLLQRDAQIGPPVDLVTIKADGSDNLIGVPIPGPDGHAVASADFAVSRDLSTLGARMLLIAVVGSVLLLLFVLLALRRVIDRMVIRPLHRFERHMGVVRSSGTLSLLTEEPRRDEIGSLVTSFNSMLRQLQDLQEQVEVQSFTLGRSESAVAVMHNVRNALNPISTILSQGIGATLQLDRAIIDRALAELGDRDVSPERREKLAAFLAAAAEAVSQERAERREQLAIGREALRNVLEIIGKQQENAHERLQLEACDLTDIVARNATIARYSGGSSIAFSFPSRSAWVLANRVILSQVVGNLFANAAEAIGASGREGGSIAVTIVEREGRIELVIRDDGEGFDPAHEPTLFQRGFSTRPHKSGGLGLHWCANSLQAMDGNLQLKSEGRGCGARAILTLPAAPTAETGDEIAA